MSVVDSPSAPPAQQPPAPVPAGGSARGKRRSSTGGGFTPLFLTLPALLLLAGLLHRSLSSAGALGASALLSA